MELLLTLAGAVALLLWGVRMVRTGMLRAFGQQLRAVLNAVAASRAKAFFAGVGITGVVQSSTATAMLISSFAARGLIALPVGLAMMLGADVGTTLVAQLFAFDIRWLWTMALAAGVIAFNAGQNDQVRNAGRIAIGFGLMLLALKVLGDVSVALRDSSTLKIVLSSIVAEPVIAVLLAALVTWAAHSSLAIVLFIMSLTAGGAIEPRLALALVLGANIGGAVAPLAALSGSKVAARRIPLGNLIARSSVAVVLVPLLGPVTRALTATGLGPASLVLVAHTAFNVLVAIVGLPLVPLLARVATRLLPEPPTIADPRQPQHLDPAALETTSEALGCAMRETLRVGDLVLDMLKRAQAAFETNDIKLVKELEKADDTVDSLHEAIKLYLIRASGSDMGETDARRFAEILTFTTNLEHIGDIIDKNLMELAAKRIKRRYVFSSEGLAELQRFHARVVDNLRLALNVFATRDVDMARRLLQEKANLRSTGFDAEERHFARLKQGRAESIETSSIHLDIIRDLKRINSHITSVAYPILEAAGQLRDSRLREREPTAVEDGPAMQIDAAGRPVTAATRTPGG